jgi:hypothetical protein
VLFGSFQASLDQLDIPLRSRDAFLRLLLKGMQDVNHASKLDGVDGAVGIAIEVIDDFKDTPATKPLQRLRGWVLVSMLGVIDRLSPGGHLSGIPASRLWTKLSTQPAFACPSPSIIAVLVKPLRCDVRRGLHQLPWRRPRFVLERKITEPLPRGRRLVTLEHAGNYIAKLPKAEHIMPEWQAAVEGPDPGCDVGWTDDVCASGSWGR